MVTQCTFTGNWAANHGGGMYNNNSGPTLTNCTFTGNRAWHLYYRTGMGGGMCNYESSPTLTNCTFSGNSGQLYGGGMASGFWSSPTVTNCTFSGNSAYRGGGVYNYYKSDSTLTNCILWDGGNEIRNHAAITITYSDVRGGWPGEGNIDADPCFVDPGYWDTNGVWVDGDCHLVPTSPCINAGDPNYIAEPNETDLDGEPRIVGGRIDMGAYESPVPAEVRIVPRTINLTSMGKWITCHISLPEDYNVADIDPNSVFFEHEIQTESLLVDKQQQIATARFSRSDVQEILNVGEVELTITGQLTDGTVFEGTDVIRVIDKAGKK